MGIPQAGARQRAVQGKLLETNILPSRLIGRFESARTVCGARARHDQRTNVSQ